jgi:hypothetical protein
MQKSEPRLEAELDRYLRRCILLPILVAHVNHA